MESYYQRHRERLLAYSKSWAKSNPDRVRKASREWRLAHPELRHLQSKKRYERNRKYILDAKNKPCVDCKVQYNYWIMDFDHRDPSTKLFDMSSISSQHSIKRIQLELDKCDLVCANCHRERTHKFNYHLSLPPTLHP